MTSVQQPTSSAPATCAHLYFFYPNYKKDVTSECNWNLYWKSCGFEQRITVPKR